MYDDIIVKMVTFWKCIGLRAAYTALHNIFNYWASYCIVKMRKK